MNEVSSGKQELASTSWETLSTQTVPSIPNMHHHQSMPQETNSMSQIIVPTPVKLQGPILSPNPNAVEHCAVLTHLQQPPLMTQVVK